MSLVTARIKIGKYFNCMAFSQVAHDCEIGDYVSFYSRVDCNGHIVIEDYVTIGNGACIRNGSREKPLRIGKGATIGMGAIVTKDVPPGATVVGNPARVVGS
jgi:acetyltransferase-like isoleucine patch superfamily enzyme